MSPNKLTVKTPGKLMVAGEYSVLEPNQHLITMAVDRYVYVTIEKSESNRLHLTDFNLTNLHWKYANEIVVESDDERISYVREALSITYTYLAELGIEFDFCTISVKSELQDESGIKYGLGSSAAVVTATVTAVLHYYLSENVEKDLIFKLAAIAHLNVQGNGSGADIAASTYGGMVRYASFQADWLLNEYENSEQMTRLIEKDWLYLSIKRLTWPSNFHLRIGWTGTPASTSHLVNNVLKLKSHNREQYDLFLKNSEQAVQQMTRGIETNDFTEFLKGVRKNRHALATIGHLANVSIETDKLRQLSDLAHNYEGAGKLSGAGGGDCGLAFVPSKKLGDSLVNAWRDNDIKPLTLTIDITGTTVIKSTSD